ncbi:putative nuclease HARBI1 [Aphis craccivora]|uniref:Putative nuclease HARBI1 n=1 Tax=Aphis craccivora TaxID=307492 RepID=A0A6G0YXW0_APHCR|nr:putative nuclease HARBI1 [Aphis craccivora]
MSDCNMLNGSTSYTPKTTKKYWIHLLNRQRDEEDLFGNFYIIGNYASSFFFNKTAYNMRHPICVDQSCHMRNSCAPV